jgi:hypothetical protein
MATNILYFHSILRCFILLFMLMVIVQSLAGMLGKLEFKKINKTGALVMMIMCDVQLLLGLAVYMMNGWQGTMARPGAMADKYSRFFGLEHPLMMVIAIVLVHLAYAVAKRNMDADRKFKRMFWFTLIALFLILSRIPWPGEAVVGRPFLPKMGVIKTQSVRVNPPLTEARS